MRWPAAWAHPAALDRVKAAGVDCLLVDNSDEFDDVRSRAADMGMRVAHPDLPPDGVRVVKGEWPGVRTARAGADASAGPTGVPWVDTNGWAVRLALALHPATAVWVDAAPPKAAFGSSYLTAVADAAAYGGRWIVTLDDALADGIANGNENALRVWNTIAGASRFFAANRSWNEWRTAATVAVVSDFAGENEFFSRELLNLLGRAGQHYVVLPKGAVSAREFRGLRAAIYADVEAPAATVRRELTAFVEGGGLLITTPVWGQPLPHGRGSDRYSITTQGKGRTARAIEPAADPYEMAQDAAVLISHRYDLVRFWNAGAAGSYVALSPDGKQAVAHLLFYADRGPDSASVRIAGPWRTVKASTVDRPEVPVETVAQKDAVEVHLPRVSQYVALELSV